MLIEIYNGLLNSKKDFATVRDSGDFFLDQVRTSLDSDNVMPKCLDYVLAVKRLNTSWNLVRKLLLPLFTHTYWIENMNQFFFFFLLHLIFQAKTPTECNSPNRMSRGMS